MDFLWSVRFPINYRNKNLKLKADFTGFSRTDDINYTLLRAFVCGVLSEQSTSARVYTDVRHARM